LKNVASERVQQGGQDDQQSEQVSTLKVEASAADQQHGPDQSETNAGNLITTRLQTEKQGSHGQCEKGNQAVEYACRGAFHPSLCNGIEVGGDAHFAQTEQDDVLQVSPGNPLPTRNNPGKKRGRGNQDTQSAGLQCGKSDQRLLDQNERGAPDQ